MTDNLLNIALEVALQQTISFVKDEKLTVTKQIVEFFD